MAVEHLNMWTLIIVSSQTLICVIISWMVLDCRLTPKPQELNEVTVMKLLYLYDPEACDRIQCYNYTVDIGVGRISYRIVWPIANKIAALMRRRIRIWLSVHVIWTLLAVANMTQSQRFCGFYVALIPFTLTGVGLLVMDVVNAATFLADIPNTGTEAAIMGYIEQTSSISVQAILKDKLIRPPAWTHSAPTEDTSWMALLMAFCSCRGIVQWVINFWLIKDNYFEGLANFRRIKRLQTQKIKHDKRRRRESVV